MRAWLLSLCLFVPVLAQAELPGTTPWRYDIPNAFRHYERAWAAYQLDPTSRAYDAGEVVQAAAAPTSNAQLFSVYKLQPGTQLTRTFQLVNPQGTDTTICAIATLRSPSELEGFFTGMRLAGAQLANSTCAPAAINSTFTYPVQLGAIKAVSAKRAAQFITTDSNERAAQASVADTITYSVPTGSNLMFFTANVNQTSGVQSALLQNMTAAPLDVTLTSFDGPFSVSLSGCTALVPSGICQADIVYQPLAAGRHQGHFTVNAAPGKSLTIRIAGTAQ